jgi:hypothetical protein
MLEVVSSDESESEQQAANSTPSHDDHPESVSSSPEGEQEQHQVLLKVRPSAVDGSCLFDSLARGLAHILKTDAAAFGAHMSRSDKEAIHAMTDPAIMREMICDHLSGPFSCAPLSCLNGLSPRLSVTADYIEQGFPLFDADWVAPSDAHPAPVAQTISTYGDYIKAMRKKGAFGDEICLAACADLLSLRLIVFDTRGFSSTATQERIVALSLDYHPDFALNPEQTQLRLVPPPPGSLRPLSSRMPLFLLRNGCHFDWMHCESDSWNEPEDSSLEVLVVATHTPVVELLNPRGFLGSTEPRALQHSATPDTLLRPLPCPLIVRAETARRRKREVRNFLVQEHAVPPELADAAIGVFETQLGMDHAKRNVKMRDLESLLKIASSLDKDLDPLAIPHQERNSTSNVERPAKSLSKHSSAASRKRKVPCTGPHPERFVPNQLNASTKRNHQDAQPFTSNYASDLESATKALMVCANISQSLSSEIMRRHAALLPDVSPLGAPLLSAFQEIQESRRQHQSSDLPAPTAGVQSTLAKELAVSRAAFISQTLGDNSRAMTPVEIAIASKTPHHESSPGVPAELVPRNLEKYWAHHQAQLLLTPRGHLPAQQYQQLIHRQSCEALHEEACKKAAAERDAIRRNISSNAATSEASLTKQPHYVAPGGEPTAGFWKEVAPTDTPASAHDPAVFASMHHQQPTAGLAMTASPSICTVAAHTQAMPSAPVRPVDEAADRRDMMSVALRIKDMLQHYVSTSFSRGETRIGEWVTQVMTATPSTASPATPIAAADDRGCCSN